MNYTKEQIFEAMMFAFNTFSDRLSISEVEDRANLYIDGLKSNETIIDKEDLPMGDKEPIPFYLQDWRTIGDNSEEYFDILYKTQELVPIDSGMSLHCHHSDFDVDGVMYRLTWSFTDVESDEPIMQRRFN